MSLCVCHIDYRSPMTLCCMLELAMALFRDGSDSLLSSLCMVTRPRGRFSINTKWAFVLDNGVAVAGCQQDSYLFRCGPSLLAAVACGLHGLDGSPVLCEYREMTPVRCYKAGLCQLVHPWQ